MGEEKKLSERENENTKEGQQKIKIKLSSDDFFYFYFLFFIIIFLTTKTVKWLPYRLFFSFSARPKNAPHALLTSGLRCNLYMDAEVIWPGALVN